MTVVARTDPLGLPQRREDGARKVGVDTIYDPVILPYSSEAELQIRLEQAHATTLLTERIAGELLSQPYGSLLCVHTPMSSIKPTSQAGAWDSQTISVRAKVHIVPWPGTCDQYDYDGSTLYMSSYPCQGCGQRTAHDADVSCALCLSKLHRRGWAAHWMTALEGRRTGAPLRAAGVRSLGRSARP